MPVICVLPVPVDKAEEARDLAARTAQYRHRGCQSHDGYGTVGAIVAALTLTLILTPLLVLTRTLARARTLT